MSILPFSEFSIKQDENNCQWIVRSCDSAAFASQSALAWMCEVDEKPIYNTLKQTKDCPKALSGMNLSNTLKITNPNAGKPIDAIPADTCYEILYYYANEARGHEKRQRAKDLCRRMGKAGAAVFIYGMAGYKLTPSKATVTPQQPNQVEITNLELTAQVALEVAKTSKSAIVIQREVEIANKNITQVLFDINGAKSHLQNEINQGHHAVSQDIKAVQLSLFSLEQTIEERIAAEVSKQLEKQSKRREQCSITVHLDPEIYARIVQDAAALDISRSAFFVQLACKYYGISGV